MTPDHNFPAALGFRPELAQSLIKHRNQNRESRLCDSIKTASRSFPMNGIIYLVGLVVVVLAILSFFGLR
jgi:hypothetical protein